MRAKSRGYGVVLLLVIASIGMQMILVGSDVTRFVTVALQAGTLVAAVRVSGMHRGPSRVAALTSVCAVIASLLLWAIRGDFPIVVSAIVNGLLVAVAPVALARGLVAELRERREVTVATLAGVLAIYLLTGMFFSFLYGVIGAVDEPALFAESIDPTRADELYFSFVTMCTVGYGDLTPAGDFTRAVAVAQMLFGQIYLVTIVSLIVANLGRRREPA
jgi:Ion channel